jgi:hypothetical protein
VTSNGRLPSTAPPHAMWRGARSPTLILAIFSYK